MAPRYINAVLCGINAGVAIYFALIGQPPGWGAFFAGNAVWIGVTALIPYRS